MTDHALGLRLRHLLLDLCGAGEPPDGRRLQALVGDLCRQEQQELLPPLRHLVLAPAFQSALRSLPPLGDPRCRQRLLQELRPVFTPVLCQRMEAVVEGLLGLAASGSAASSAAASAPAASTPPPSAPTAGFTASSAAAAPRPGPGDAAANAHPDGEWALEARDRQRPGPALQPLPLVLAMAACVALGIGAAGLWWESEGQRQQVAPRGGAPVAPLPAPGSASQAGGEADPFRTEESPANPSTTPADPFAAREEASSPPEDPASATSSSPFSPSSPSASPAASPDSNPSASSAPLPPPLPPLPSASPSAAGRAGAAADGSQEGALQTAAVEQLKGLYSSLSRQDFAAARGYFSPRVADQFDPAFFRQFSRVEVAQLVPVGRSTTTLTLRGVVRFAYPDGSSQLESRSFTFSTLDNPPRVINSAFGAVLQARSASTR